MPPYGRLTLRVMAQLSAFMHFPAICADQSEPFRLKQVVVSVRWLGLCVMMKKGLPKQPFIAQTPLNRSSTGQTQQGESSG